MTCRVACRQIANCLQMTRPFSVVHDVTIGSSELNSDLAKLSEWAFKWKMSFNPDQFKPAQN